MQFQLKNKFIFFRALLTAILLLSVPVAGIPPQVQQDEFSLKALFIYNFTRHIEWPYKQNDDETFLISIVGNTPLTKKLTALVAGKKIQNKSVVVAESNSNECAGSDIIYICRENNNRLQEIVNIYGGKGVLIISEDRNLTKKGSCINIIRDKDHMKFEISESNMRREKLKVSNQLYELAVQIR